MDEGRLSIVDPVDRRELASFGGLGFGPGDLTADNGERLLISSRTEGLMEFDTAERTVIRGEGNGRRDTRQHRGGGGFAGTDLCPGGRLLGNRGRPRASAGLHRDPDGTGRAMRQPGAARPGAGGR